MVAWNPRRNIPIRRAEMRYFGLLAIGVVLLVLVGSILGMACTGAQGEQGPQGIQGESGPNMIAAMGTVTGDGTIYSGYNVASATWDSTLHCYNVGLTGIEYNVWDYVTMVSLIESDNTGRTIESTSSFGGELLVYIYDDAGNPVGDHFSFMVLDTSLA
jgi:hypothetical protein